MNADEEQSVLDEQMRVLLQEKLHQLDSLAVDDPPVSERPTGLWFLQENLLSFILTRNS